VPHRQGVRDVIRTVKSLDIPRFHYSQIQRGRSVGEGETFWVEQCQVDGKAVAVKHLKVGRCESGRPEFLRRVESLLLELRIMHHNPLKSHPNILTLIGYGWNTDGGGILPYILVDYCANGNARQYLRAKRVPPIHKELMIADVAAGIHALHTTGIVHGDVKLENVLVFDGVQDTRRSHPLAKLCDFGHSIVIGLGLESQEPAFFGGTSRYVHLQDFHITLL
jgi:serine/threonine protein kinase